MRIAMELSNEIGILIELQISMELVVVMELGNAKEWEF